MKLSQIESRARLKAHDHGVLSTLNPARGVDAVPAVYALANDNFLGIPIDQVKPKSTVKLERISNLEIDPRASLLIEQWDTHDWTKLWWVRATLEWRSCPDETLTSELSKQLAKQYEQYRDEPFERILVFQVVELTGWCASELPT